MSSSFPGEPSDSDIVDYQQITTERQLQQYCDELAGCDWIALDTEFVSEHTYRPVLCLIQVATDAQAAVIDALAIEEVTPFWEAVAKPGHETILHAGRGEMEFCLEAIGRLPQNVFDVQLAAGFVGAEYPAGYFSLINRLLGERSHRHETRTDWRRRPLSRRQIQYALDDARYLKPLRDKLYERLERLDRLDWFRDEIAAWHEEIRRARSRQRWRRVSGNTALDGRGLAILREVWRWREKEARRRDTPVRRVLRDDLIVELAKRRTAEPRRIAAVRGLERGDLKRRLGEIAEAIKRALELPEEECPKPGLPAPRRRHAVLGQFLFAALGSICRRERIASSLVGSPNDIRELIAHRLGEDDGASRREPQLARGWRAEFVGRLFEDLLAGKLAVRIDDPSSEHPLLLEPRADAADPADKGDPS
jgi:ribonuclease D